LEVKAAGAYVCKLYQFHMPTVHKSWIFKLLELYGFVTGL